MSATIAHLAKINQLPLEDEIVLLGGTEPSFFFGANNFQNGRLKTVMSESVYAGEAKHYANGNKFKAATAI